ncbi:PREDICTED: uncharacterized protein LOC104758738 [Camelina sativa]|uniref:Uncharacterized protein LOC104758738 n=1 Tax=Camelina sativa TaxID=90675 RepID=A0ABM1R5Q9_CAMSA|nr:PREDICTED: uncharacterized protein LOC104758738 [Camelina sativa]
MVKASSKPSDSGSVSTKTSGDTGADVVFTAPPGFKPPEPKRFAIKSGKLFDVLGASIGLIFRFGTGVFVSGYSASFVSKEEIPADQYALCLRGLDGIFTFYDSIKAREDRSVIYKRTLVTQKLEPKLQKKQ